MKKISPKLISAKSPIAGQDMDLTELFRLAGLPHKVVATARFAARHQLTGDGCEHEHYALIWSVRSALTGCLPVRRFRTTRGQLLLIEYPGFPGGTGRDQTVLVAVLLTVPGMIHLLLPEEFEEIPKPQ